MGFGCYIATFPVMLLVLGCLGFFIGPLILLTLFCLLPWLVMSVPFSPFPVSLSCILPDTCQIHVSCNFREVGGVVLSIN